MWDTPDHHGLIFSLFKYHCVVHFLTFDRMSFGNSFVIRHFNPVSLPYKLKDNDKSNTVKISPSLLLFRQNSIWYVHM